MKPCRKLHAHEHEHERSFELELEPLLEGEKGKINENFEIVMVIC